jgi:hypothetical protein
MEDAELQVDFQRRGALNRRSLAPAADCCDFYWYVLELQQVVTYVGFRNRLGRVGPNSR